MARPKPGLTALIATRLAELAIAADHETAVKRHPLRLAVAQMRVLLALSDERVAQSALDRPVPLAEGDAGPVR